jgi:hypothetical protein
MRKWLSILVAVMAIAALVAAGCGGSDDNGGGGDTGGGNGDMSAQEIITASQKAMDGIQTAAFDMDMKLAIQGDASLMTDPQAQQLLASPIAVKASGKLGNEPQKLDMTMTADAMGQSFDLGMKMDGEVVYLQYMGQWYEIPKDMATGITGASPAPDAESEKLTDAYKQLGVDPNAWASGYTNEGEEDVNGVKVYHITQQIDIDKVAADLSKLAGSASGLGSIVGGQAGTDPEDLQKSIDMLKAAVKDVKVEYWIGVDDSYIYKMQAAAMIDIAALPEEERQGAEGLESMDFSMMLSMSDYNQDFSVEPPSGAKPFDQLFNDLMQSGGLSL